MRVLHVIPAVADCYGGPSRAIFDMCRALEDRGVETLVATTDADGTGHLAVPLGQPTHYRGLPMIFFRRQVSEGLKYSRTLARWLGAHVADFDVVEVHAVFSHACLAAARACRRHGVPYVVRPLGTLDPRGLARKSFRKALVWRWSARAMLQQAAAVHYTTLEERQLAEATLGLERGTVIPLGVDRSLLEDDEGEVFRARHPQLGDDPYVLTLSRLDPIKGLEVLLDAFGALRVRQELARWQLVVAGDGDAGFVESLRRRATTAGARAHFVGWLDGAERVAALRGASLFAAPSRQESFGLAVVEAMACGVPVLTSDRVNLAGEIRIAGAGWVAPLEATAIEGALADALQDEGERAARGRAGRSLVRARFQWSGIAGQLEELYTAIGSRKTWPSAGKLVCEGEGRMATPSVAVVVLTLNEARNLPACLESIRGWAREVFVVDSGSRDDTVAIARHLGASVVHHDFESHARQWNWALNNLPLSADWVLALDADQRLTPELRDEISRRLVARKPGDRGPVGYYVRRRQVFRGRWIRHGGYYPKYLLKLFKRGSARSDENELVDFRLYVEGDTDKLPGDLIEDNRNEWEIAFWIAKHNKFAVLQAREEFARQGSRSDWSVRPTIFGTPDQQTLWLKRIWYRMPLYVRPFLYFAYRYFMRLGFLDGKEGFVFHLLQAFWYRLLVDINLEELRKRAPEAKD